MTYARNTNLSRSNQRLNRQILPTSANTRTFNSFSNIIVISVLVCLLIVIYLLQVNTTNSYSYIINDLNVEQQQLEQEYQGLVIKGTQLESNQRLVADTNTTTEFSLPTEIHFVD